MRKIVLLVSLLSVYALGAEAQMDRPTQPLADDTSKPYLQYPGMPAFNILETDSSTIFNTYNIPKGNMTALVLFDPDCSHCQRMINSLVSGMDSVKDIQFYFVTLARSTERLRQFYEEYHMGNYKNIVVVGRDSEFFFLSYYKTRSFPAIALYDKQKKFIALKEGSFTATNVYKMAH